METITSAAASVTSAAASITSGAVKLLECAGTIAVVGAGVACILLLIMKVREKLFDGKSDKKASE